MRSVKNREAFILIATQPKLLAQMIEKGLRSKNRKDIYYGKRALTIIQGQLRVF